MANWRHKIELNQVIEDLSEKYNLSCHEEDCPQEVKEGIAKEIEKAWPIKRHADEVRKVKSIAALYRRLDLVFDDADTHLVWCGM